MSILRRAANGATALVVAFSSVLTLMVPATTYAAGQTCTWTGAGSDANFSTSANWSGCGGAAPTDNDVVTFDVTSLTKDTTITNDISGLTVDGLSVTGTNQNYAYTFDGDFTINGDIATSKSTEFNGTLTLAKDITVTGSLWLNDTASIDVAGFTLTMGTGSIWLQGSVTGSGHIVIDGENSWIDLLGEASTYTGSIEMKNKASIFVSNTGLNAASTFTVNPDSRLVLCGFKGASVASSLVVGGNGTNYGAIGTYAMCYGGSNVDSTGVDTDASVNWTGSVTLTADTLVGGTGDFKITGPLSGAFTIAQAAGTRGQVTVASSNNTSKTANGTQASQLEKITLAENKPDESFYVNTNQEKTLTGTYLAATISGGVLKGTGTLKGLLEVTTAGTVAPGMSPGCLTSDTLNLAGTYLFEIGGTDACTGYDQLKVLNASNTADAVTLDDTSATLTTSLYDGFVPKKGQT